MLHPVTRYQQFVVVGLFVVVFVVVVCLCFFFFGGGGGGRGMGRRRESVSPFTKHGCVCITSPLRVTCYIRLQDTNSFESG